MLKNDLLWHPLGGVHQVTFLMVFGIWAPSGAQEASRGSPGVPRATPSTNFSWFLVDLGWILEWFWLLLGVPGSAQAIKWISKFGQHSPCVWRVQGYQNLGSIPPVPQPPKWISKFGQHSVLLFKSAREQIDIWFCQSTMPKPKRWPLS